MGYIVLAQACQLMVMMFCTHDFCTSFINVSMQDMLITPGSKASEALGGFVLFKVDNYTLAGISEILMMLLYYSSYYLEVIYTINLNFDVVITIRFPFQRGQLLSKIKWFRRLSLLGIFILMVSAVHEIVVDVKTVDYISSQDFDFDSLDDEIAFNDNWHKVRIIDFLQYNSFFDSPTFVISMFYLSSTLGVLILTLSKSLCRF